MIELHRPLAATLAAVADHLPGAARATLDRIARLDRERTPGTHAFEYLELVELIGCAYALLRDPPDPIRRTRRVPRGALPAAERVGILLDWLRERPCEAVVYDLWGSTAALAD